MALNATSVGVWRRNSSVSVAETVFIISIDIALVVVMVMYQNCQVMVTSFGSCWYSGCSPQSPDCWRSCTLGAREGEGWGEWRVIAVSLLKMYARMACEI